MNALKPYEDNSWKRQVFTATLASLDLHTVNPFYTDTRYNTGIPAL